MEEIRWENIKTGVGTAEHVPEAIVKLGSIMEEDRESAYWKIDNYVIIQSDLYEAAFYVIDLIVELLMKPYSVNRFYPLSVLNEIALGCSNERIKVAGMESEIFLEQGCKNKLLKYSESIRSVKVIDDDEIEEKESLLNEIEELKTNQG